MIRIPTTVLRLTKCDAYLQRLSHCYSHSSRAERVTVPCQSNGSINLDIYHSLIRTTVATDSRAVLVYLPRGPYLANDEHDASTVSVLRSNLACPIVRINYRFGQEQKFPTPVHDVLVGYDWIVENMLPKRSITRAGRSEHVGKLGVCGEFVGGSLAAALALTECRVGEPGIVAAALNNPIADWVSIGEEVPRQTNTTFPARLKASNPDVQILLSLRAQLFKKPEHFFDPFASPILFFRSAGVDVPAAPAFDPEDDLEHLSILEREEALLGDSITDDLVNVSNARKQRRASRRFPSKTLGLRLPSFNVSAGLASPLHNQAGELTKALRQSVVRQSQQALTRSSGFGRKVLEDDEDDEMSFDEQQTLAAQKAEAQEKARLTANEGPGLWDDSEEGKARVVEVSTWLRTLLE